MPTNKNFGQRKVSNEREANFGDFAQKTGTADYAADLEGMDHGELIGHGNMVVGKGIRTTVQCFSCAFLWFFVFCFGEKSIFASFLAG